MAYACREYSTFIPNCLKLIEQIKRDGSCYYSKIFMIIVGRNSLCVFAYTNLTSRKDYLIGGIYENLYCDK